MLSPRERAWTEERALYHCETRIYVLVDLGLNPIKGEQYSAAGDTWVKPIQFLIEHNPLYRSSLFLPQKPQRLLETQPFHSQSYSKFYVRTLNLCWLQESIKQPRLAWIEMGIILGQELFFCSCLENSYLYFKTPFKYPSYKIPLSRHSFSLLSQCFLCSLQFLF